MPTPTHKRIVVGAGPAGCAAAVLLARAGQPPLLLERSRGEQPRLCGEFISKEACTALAALGVDVSALGGQATRRLRLVCGRQCIDAELPFTAYGLTRCALDGALQSQAEAEGTTLWRGARAGLSRVARGQQPHRLEVAMADGPPRELQTRQLLLACGKSDLAPLQRRPHHAPEDLVGWQTHLRLQPEQQAMLQGYVEVFLFDGGYGGLQPVEGGRVNLCLLVPRTMRSASLPLLLQAVGDQCPLLVQRLHGAVWDERPPSSIFRVPYGFLHRDSPGNPPGLWRLGDQAAVIPSFTGDGIAVALHTAAVAAQELLAGADERSYHRRLHHELRWQIARAMGLYRVGRVVPVRGALLQMMQRWPSIAAWLATITRVPGATL